MLLTDDSQSAQAAPFAGGGPLFGIRLVGNTASVFVNPQSVARSPTDDETAEVRSSRFVRFAAAAVVGLNVLLPAVELGRVALASDVAGNLAAMLVATAWRSPRSAVWPAGTKSCR